MINKNISYYFNSSDSRSRIYYNFDHILELIASDPKLSKQTDMIREGLQGRETQTPHDSPFRNIRLQKR